MLIILMCHFTAAILSAYRGQVNLDDLLIAEQLTGEQIEQCFQEANKLRAIAG